MPLRPVVPALAVALLVAAGGLREESRAQDGAGTVEAQIEETTITVRVDGDPFTAYEYADTLKYPYFYPVNGPRTGTSVTTESSESWPHHHSLFFACDRVDGGNYWQEGLDRGRIAAREVSVPVARGDSVVIVNETRWQRPGAEAPLRGDRRLVIRAPGPEIRIIDWTVTLTALEDVTIRRSNHALFAARMVPALSVDSGGVLVNAEGDRGESETWGRRAPWADYYGTRDGRTEGLAILTHPSNPWHPAPWFTRNYGFFSPTPMQWLADGRFDLDEGERLTLRYRVIVHAGTAEEAGIAERYAAWAGRASSWP